MPERDKVVLHEVNSLSGKRLRSVVAYADRSIVHADVRPRRRHFSVDASDAVPIEITVSK